MALTFDQVGYWSEIKLDIVRRYALEYSKILSGHGLYHVYIDAYAGSGRHISRTTKSLVPGSPRIALDITPAFREYYFIDIDGAKVAELNKLVADRPEAHVLQGDCNSILLTDVFPNVMYRDYRRGLCLLDPYGLDLDWKVTEAAGQMKSIEIFLNFPVMDMNRNVLWANPDGVDPADIVRMNSFWGDESWREAAYRRAPNLFGEMREIKERNIVTALAFGERLREVAGFDHVSQPMPMRNSRGAIIYYLYFASQQQLADRIITYIFHKYRGRGIT